MLPIHAGEDRHNCPDLVIPDLKRVVFRQPDQREPTPDETGVGLRALSQKPFSSTC